MVRNFLAALVLLIPAAAAEPFTLEQVLSAPFPSELIAAPAGNLAWLLNERGARNIWIASPPDYKGVRLTSYAADDGQDTGQLRWTPDGRAVVYVRGGDLEFPGGADPNPASNPAGVEQAIWIAAPGQPPRRIAEGHSPAVSPGGDRVAFIKAGQVWSAPLAPNGRPEQLVHARTGVTADELRWSPDGSRLAFVSDRSDHSFIAVYDVAAKTLLYLDPGVDRDRNPTWSPDGTQIAFIRLPASKEIAFGPHRAGMPWSIRVANVTDGAGRQVWKAREGPGSVFHGIVAETQLFWGAGGRLVFPWERDGWVHLYSVATEAASPEADSATLLTPGAFEVEHVSLSRDGRDLVYSSNQDDIDRRHIWRVSVAGGAPRALTRGDGIEWSPLLVGQALVMLHSGAREPARAAIQVGSAIRDLAPDSIPADFPAGSLSIPQQVIFSASDGMAIHGQLFLPPARRDAPRHPALVFMHGGSRRQMLLGWHHMEYYYNAYGMNQYLASLGFVVLSINYRSGIGYGLDFREAIDYGASGASEFRDVEGAGLYLRSRGDVDPGRIGLWGGSYGGYLTALGLARASDLFSAGVDFHGVHDWSALRSAPSDPAGQEAARVAFQSSPMASVKTWRSPVLLIHGDDDRNVPFSETVTLAAALRQQGVSFEQLVIPDEIHSFLKHGSWLRAYHAAADFFRRTMRLP